MFVEFYANKFHFFLEPNCSQNYKLVPFEFFVSSRLPNNGPCAFFFEFIICIFGIGFLGVNVVFTTSQKTKIRSNQPLFGCLENKMNLSKRGLEMETGCWWENGWLGGLTQAGRVPFVFSRALAGKQ